MIVPILYLYRYFAVGGIVSNKIEPYDWYVIREVEYGNVFSVGHKMFKNNFFAFIHFIYVRILCAFNML